MIEKDKKKKSILEWNLITDLNSLPKENKYVLVYVPNTPWYDIYDQEHVRMKVAKLVRGLSVEERKNLPDTDIKKRTYVTGDEDGNNKVPYEWRTFRATGFFGQEVTHWAELPNRPKKEKIF